MADPKTRTLKLSSIEADPAIQPRADGLHAETVAEYAAAMKAAAAFPPGRVFRDDAAGKLWLSRGFHRVAAAAKAGLEEFEFEVIHGTRKDAVVDAAGSNADHGLRRTNADKRRAVENLLREFPEWSDRKAADAAGVGHQLAAEVRRQLDDSSSCGDPPKRVGKDGKARKAPPKPDPEPEAEDESPGGGDDGDDSHDAPAVVDGSTLAGPDPESPGTDAPLPSTRTDAERAAREAAAAKLDEQPDGAGMVVSYADAGKCRDVVTAMNRALNKFQEHLSGLMAGDFAPGVRNAAKGYGFDVWTDGSLQGNTAWGAVRYGVAKYSCGPLDDLHGFVGGLKLMFDRADARPAGAGPTDQPTDAQAFGAAMRDTDDDVEF